MNKVFSIIFVFLFGVCVYAKEFVVPSLTGRVVDVSNTLSSSDIKSLEEACKAFEKKTGGQFAVCIVPTIEGESIESASMKVAEAWKIGHKGKDNGMLFLLAMKEREFRIEVGYGFEGKLNDGKAGELGRFSIPMFKEKKWHDGIKYIIDSSGQILAGEKTFEEIEKENQSKVPVWLVIVIICVIIFIMVATNDGCSGVYVSTGSSYKGGSGYSGGGFKGGGGSFGGGGFSGKF